MFSRFKIVDGRLPEFPDPIQDYLCWANYSSQRHCDDFRREIAREHVGLLINVIVMKFWVTAWSNYSYRSCAHWICILFCQERSGHFCYWHVNRAHEPGRRSFMNNSTYVRNGNNQRRSNAYAPKTRPGIAFSKVVAYLLTWNCNFWKNYWA